MQLAAQELITLSKNQMSWASFRAGLYCTSLPASVFPPFALLCFMAPAVPNMLDLDGYYSHTGKKDFERERVEPRTPVPSLGTTADILA